jgi:sulfur relay (sulfurtransferase) DsrC/TusE family protein
MILFDYKVSSVILLCNEDVELDVEMMMYINYNDSSIHLMSTQYYLVQFLRTFFRNYRNNFYMLCVDM